MLFFLCGGHWHWGACFKYLQLTVERMINDCCWVFIPHRAPWSWWSFAMEHGLICFLNRWFQMQKLGTRPASKTPPRVKSDLSTEIVLKRCVIFHMSLVFSRETIPRIWRIFVINSEVMIFVAGPPSNQTHGKYRCLMVFGHIKDMDFTRKTSKYVGYGGKMSSGTNCQNPMAPRGPRSVPLPPSWLQEPWHLSENWERRWEILENPWLIHVEKVWWFHTKCCEVMSLLMIGSNNN